MQYSEEWLANNPENFPVASWLLPGEFRKPIMAFYAFARGADEIADNNTIPETIRKDRLNALDHFLVSADMRDAPEFAKPLFAQLRHHPHLVQYARDLLSAFLQDVTKSRYRDYNDLLDYCARSAAPVGRAILYICHENDVEIARADALCNALQILNHLQDCGYDYTELGRVYLPLEWFTLANAQVAHLGKEKSTPAVRKVIDRTLDNCEQLLHKAEPMLDSINHPRLKREIALIFELACALCDKLRTHDPLQSYVRVGRIQSFLLLLKILVFT